MSGGIPYPAMQPPSEITVRVRDDSPQSDEAGAIVYDIVLELEGEGPKGEATISSDPADDRFAPGLQAQVLGGRRGDGFREVRGEETVEYLVRHTGEFCTT